MMQTERMWSRFVSLFAATLLLPLCAQAVDRSNFKTCDQSSFCKRNRALTPGASPYKVVVDSIAIEDTGCQMDILNTRTNVLLRAEISTLQDSMFRLKINEKSPMRPRYEVEGALAADPKRDRCKVQRSSSGMEITSTKTKASVTFEPFQMEFYINNEIAVVLNSRGLMNFEHYRSKRFVPTAPPPDEGNSDEENPDKDAANEEAKAEEDEDVPPVEGGDDEPGMWDETFKTHTDTKPYGPSSIGMDISFPGVEHVYGIPEHADSLALKPTVGGEPYRLYNLDVFEYELNNQMALYGSIPVMLAHNWSKTVGVFWHNAAETWIDISNAAANRNILGKLLSYFKSDDEIPQTDTHWMSESGVIDVFIMLGPRTSDIFRQYASLTGNTVLPPLFSLAYHQSRWNYNDEQDVENVDNGFDENDIPYDVLWLDIEHTDGKRYFTWDLAKFPNAAEMQNKLAAKGRKMVTIIDPHIKRDGNYHIHKDAEAKNLYVKRSDGTSAYEGWCWPGSSSWIDFVSPENRRWWAEQFAPDKYQGSTNNLFTWNDMNEPSVFNGPEITMHKDCKHFGGWEHRDVHNIYGMFAHQATAEGQIMRSGGRDRPFVLSRAFFAGTQRFGAIWTGDNKAAWDHLAASVPMLLSVSIAGLPFVGADVGGFFGNPDVDLLVRWYQAGIFYPFFRAHAHLDTRRREPWLYDADKTAIMREAIRLRYQLLPLWYMLFYESHKKGMPVIRPLWVDFPRDKNTYALDSQFMVGGYLMVKPVVEQYATTTQVYLPGYNALWYDFDDFTLYKGASHYQINTPLNKIPIFQKGGAIVAMKQRVRRSSAAMDNDPYTLVVALDVDGDAMGKIFIDDGHSFDYKDGKFILQHFTFTTNTLIGGPGDPSGRYETKSWLEKIIVVGIKGTPPTKALLFCDGDERYLDISFDDSHKNHVLTIRKPGINVSRDFSITLS